VVLNEIITTPTPAESGSVAIFEDSDEPILAAEAMMLIEQIKNATKVMRRKVASIMFAPFVKD